MKMILASGSPRRVELLNLFNIDFDVIPSHIDENVRIIETPEQIVMGLAYEKALDIAKQYPDALIIASDTIVYCDRVLGKPASLSHARDMLFKLNNQSHHVFTGIAMIQLNSNRKIVDFVKTTVVFNDLTIDEIERYISTGEPMDKAGAYGIQGKGAVLVNRIEGDYFNVMGLPLSKLNQLLKQHFNLSLL